MEESKKTKLPLAKLSESSNILTKNRLEGLHKPLITHLVCQPKSFSTQPYNIFSTGSSPHTTNLRFRYLQIVLQLMPSKSQPKRSNTMNQKTLSPYLAYALTTVLFLSLLLFGTKGWGQCKCTNADFSFGDFSNWIGHYGYFDNPSLNSGILPGRHTIISTNYTDPFTCNQLNTIPLGATFSAKLGNENADFEAEQLSYTFLVTDTTNLFLYNYAVVLEDPGHDPDEQPSFSMTVKDQFNQIIDPICGYYYVVAQQNLPNWNVCGSIVWKDWTKVGMDLTPYMGQTITIEFTTKDCSLGAHFGYAYLTAFCGSLSINSTFCEKTNIAQLTAPTGFSYLWNTGETSQNITINNPMNGATYSCTLTAENGCQVEISTTLEQTLIDPNFTYMPNCVGQPVSFLDQSICNNSTITNWKWSFSDGSPSVNGIQNPFHSFPLPTTYNTQLIAFSLNGCSDTIFNAIDVFPYPNNFGLLATGLYPNNIGYALNLMDSEPGIFYRVLFNEDTLTPFPGVIGTGNPVLLGNFNQIGTYHVIARNYQTGCQIVFSDSLVISQPIIYNVIGGGELCLGDSGLNVGLDGSTQGNLYVLYQNNIVVDSLYGTGSVVNFGIFSTSGYYNVVAIDTVSGLQSLMNGNALIIVHPLPVPFSLVPSGIQCPGTQLFANGSQLGVNYIVFRRNSPIDTIAGTGQWALQPLIMANDTGLYHVLAVNAVTGCTQHLLDTTTIVPSPEVYNLNPAGILCEGTSIWIDQSQSGIYYQLKRDNQVNVGSPVPGTGTAINFGPVYYPGVYKVLAINPFTLCSIYMNDSAVLYPLPIQYSISPVGDSCAPVLVGLNGSQTGYQYDLYLNDYFPPLSSIIGTGSAITFGEFTLSGTYKIKAINLATLCESMMNDSIVVYPRPDAFDLIPSGPVCPGTLVKLDNSELGMFYQLYKDGQYAIGPPVAGTGMIIDLGIVELAGTYTAVAYSSTTACSEIMNGTVVVEPNPQLFTITPQSNHCAGTVVGLSGSELGVEYRLIYNNQLTTPLAIVQGSGGMLSFAAQYLPGTYKIAAFKAPGYCTNWMLDSVMIVQKPLEFTVIPGGANCEPTQVMLSGSEIGVSYELLKNGLPFTLPIIVPGTGGMLSFGPQMGGNYSVRATTATLSCSLMMLDTVVVTPMPTVDAGADALVCSDATYQANAQVTGYSSLLWTTSGDGLFSDQTIPNPIYTPGIVDLATAAVTLTLTAEGTPECPAVTVSDAVILQFHPIPQVNAGADFTNCAGLPVAVAATAVNVSTSQWSSTGDGVFVDPSSLTTTYQPGLSDQMNGTVNLIVTAWGTTACGTTTSIDTVLITLAPLPVAQAGNDTTICEADFAICHGKGLHASANVLWHTTGDGYFATPSQLYSLYYPGILDKNVGQVHLYLEVSGINSCSSILDYDTLTLSLHALPIVNAGNDFSVCANSAQLTLNGQVTGGYTATTWSSSGFGTFGSSASLTTTYSLTSADTTLGSLAMYLTASGNQQCALQSQTDTVIITIDPVPQVMAGADTFVCENASISLAATALHTIGTQWATMGDGTFANPTSLTATYTPGTADKAMGTANLVLTGFGSATCTGSTHTDTLVLTVQPLPTASITGNDTLCKGEQTLLNISFTGVPPFAVSISNGLENISASNINTFTYQLPVSPQVTSTYYITACSDYYCDGTNFTGSAIIYVNPVPQLFTLSALGGGFFCEGGTGPEIQLNGSQYGISYQLFASGIALGNPMIGTGLPLNFGSYSVPGIYTCVATNVVTNCLRTMNGTVHLIMVPEVDVDFEGDSACKNIPHQFTITGTDIQDITLWEWDFGDGNSASYLSAINPTHTYLGDGDFLVSLHLTTLFGCEKTILHPIHVGKSPISLFSLAGIGCPGDTVVFTNHSYTTAPAYISSSTWIFGDGQQTTLNWPNNQSTTHQYSQTGTYTVKLIVTANDGCVGESSQDIEVINGPNAGFYASTACEDAEVQFTDISQSSPNNPITAWEWDFGDVNSGLANTSINQHPVHVFQAPGAYQVKLTVSTAGGCQASITHTLQVHSKPLALFEADSACVNLPSVFTDLSTCMDGTITNWLWDFGDGTPNSFAQNPTHTYASNGSWPVNLEVSSSFGCTDDTIIMVHTLPSPLANIAAVGEQCKNSEVAFEDLSTTPQGYINQWIWNFGDGNSTTLNMPSTGSTSHTYATTGTYNITLTVVTNNGCTDTETHTLHIQNGPIAAFNQSLVLCQGQQVQFSNQSSANGGSPINQWFWDFGDPASGIMDTASVQNPTHTFQAPGNYLVKLRISNLIGCFDSVEHTVVVNPKPMANFEADSSCLYTTTQFNDLSVANIGVITNWLWDFGDGTNTSLLQNPQHSYATAGVYNATLQVTNSYSCTKDTSLPVFVRMLPIAAFTNSTQNCAGSPVAFQNQSSAPEGYINQWHYNFGDGTDTTIVFPDIPDVEHVFPGIGTFLVTLTVTTNYGCTHTTAHQITTQQVPNAQFSTGSQTCKLLALQFTDNSYTAGGTPIIAWSWDFGDPTSGILNTSVLQNPMHIFDTAGTYQVKLIVQNQNGCYDSITQTFAIGENPLASFGADSVCFDSPTHFSDSSLANTANLASWLWDFGDGTTSSLQNPEHTFTTWGTHQVNLLVTNDLGCTDDTTLAVFVKPLPVPAFASEQFCAGYTTQFTDLSVTPAGVITNWLWDFGDGSPTDTLQHPTHTYSLGNSYEVSLTVTNSFGCQQNLNQAVLIFNSPVANFNSYSVNCPAGEVTFQDLSLGNGSPIVTRYWDFGDGYHSTAANPIYRYAVPNMNYDVTLIVENAQGCPDTLVKTIFVKPGFAFQIQQQVGCAGSPSNFSPLNLAAGDTLMYVLWNFGDPTSGVLNQSTDYHATHTYTTPGTYFPRLKVWKSDNCVDSTYIEITVYEPPVASFAWNTGVPACDSTITFINYCEGNGATIDSVLWQFGDNVDSVQYYPVPPMMTHKFAHYGIFDVQLTCFVSNYCSHSISKSVTAKCLSAAFTQVDTIACQNGLTVFADSSAPSAGISKWLWLFGDGEYEEYYDYKPFIEHPYKDAGYFMVKLFTTATINGLQVQDTMAKQILVHHAPVASFATSELCMHDTIHFTDLSTIAYDTLTTWNWSFGDGTFDTLQHPVHRYFYDTDFTAELIVKTNVGCSDTIALPIQLKPAPLVNLVTKSNLICIGDEDVILRDTSGLAYDDYYWDWGDADTSITHTPMASHRYQSGTYQATLSVNASWGCKGIDTVNFEVHQKPEADFYVDPADSVSILAADFQFTDQSYSFESSLYNWHWYFGDGADTLNQNPKHTYADTGTYIVELHATNLLGCTDTVIKTIRVYPELTLVAPNAFTPNYDGLNQEFKPKVRYEKLDSYLLQIYTRWGQLIFETHNPAVGWDGTYKGEKVSPGMYIWLVDLKHPDGKPEIFKGNVMLIR